MNGGRGIDPNQKKFSPILEREKRLFGEYMRAKVWGNLLWIVVLSILNLILVVVIVGIVLRGLGKGG